MRLGRRELACLRPHPLLALHLALQSALDARMPRTRCIEPVEHALWKVVRLVLEHDALRLERDETKRRRRTRLRRGKVERPLLRRRDPEELERHRAPILDVTMEAKQR